jgi:hypothetical protein
LNGAQNVTPHLQQQQQQQQQVTVLS